MLEALLERGILSELSGKTGEISNAVKCYRKAAIRGNTKAQFLLSLAYAAGQAHRKNHRLALAWFKRAAAGGEELCALAVDRAPHSVNREVAEFRRLLAYL